MCISGSYRDMALWTLSLLTGVRFFNSGKEATQQTFPIMCLKTPTALTQHQFRRLNSKNQHDFLGYLEYQNIISQN